MKMLPASFRHNVEISALPVFEFYKEGVSVEGVLSEGQFSKRCFGQKVNCQKVFWKRSFVRRSFGGVTYVSHAKFI